LQSVEEKPASYNVWVADRIVIANAARAQLKLALIVSKSGPVVIKAAVPLIRNPVPGPYIPATLLLPTVINTLLLQAMLASVCCIYPAGINKRPSFVICT